MNYLLCTPLQVETYNYTETFSMRRPQDWCTMGIRTPANIVYLLSAWIQRLHCCWRLEVRVKDCEESIHAADTVQSGELSSVQFKMVYMRSGRAHMRSTPSLRSFQECCPWNSANVGLIWRWPLVPRPLKEDRWALPFSTLLSSRRPMVKWDRWTRNGQILFNNFHQFRLL